MQATGCLAKQRLRSAVCARLYAFDQLYVFGSGRREAGANGCCSLKIGTRHALAADFCFQGSLPAVSAMACSVRPLFFVERPPRSRRKSCQSGNFSHRKPAITPKKLPIGQLFAPQTGDNAEKVAFRAAFRAANRRPRRKSCLSGSFSRRRPANTPKKLPVQQLSAPQTGDHAEKAANRAAFHRRPATTPKKLPFGQLFAPQTGDNAEKVA
ncbi:hypothetical protein GXP70_04105 [Paenibacillus lycopersici]|uniref:Uncharacterized protein n=1 Tax=Paenibacillus lycopersici TaxID=2704462 RepID=A0A6C0FYE3_9BACL|nr:hypothetical protein [Paenibacillus lycopersici]QHT59230.1 hypothetical protein GXP70_04105 [Paenibacillus lycopersici]